MIISGAILVVLALLAIVVFLYIFKKLWKFAINSIIGLIALWILNEVGVKISLSVSNVIICAILGIPGVILLAVLSVLGIAV